MTAGNLDQGTSRGLLLAVTLTAVLSTAVCAPAGGQASAATRSDARCEASGAPSPAQDRSSLGDGYAETVIGDRPVSYWRLDEPAGVVALDAWGRNSGFYRDRPQLGRPSLLPGDPLGHSVSFGGSAGERVDVPGVGLLKGSGCVSIETWVELPVLSRGDEVAFIAGQPGAFSLRVDAGRLVFAIGRRSTGPNCVRVSLGTSFSAGETHHLVATYDGMTARLFVDGTSVAGVRLAQMLPPSARSFEIGSTGGPGGQFRGVIDEVALYGRALTPAQVSAHYGAGAWPRLNS